MYKYLHYFVPLVPYLQNAQIGGNQSADSTYLKVITDEPDSREQILDFDKYSRTLAKIIENSTPRFTVGVFGDWGTGKTTLMLMIRDYLKKNGKILTVWFDAWRYEREKNLAVVPFLRVTKLSLEEFTSKLNKTEGRRWEGIKKGLQHTLIAFFKSTKVTYGIKDIISVETDFKQFSSNLNGNIANIDDRDYFYYHATGYLEHALDDLRRGRDGDPRMKGDPQYRIVIFVDDLDRYSPDKGLEILESIKSFFDIEGIIYVVGMNYNSIDALIKQKYSQNPNISGLDYMKKIVQLPFHIPQWNESDILNFVNSVTSNELKDSEINTELSNNDHLF